MYNIPMGFAVRIVNSADPAIATPRRHDPPIAGVSTVLQLDSVQGFRNRRQYAQQTCVL